MLTFGTIWLACLAVFLEMAEQAPVIDDRS